jgi:cholesterol oxidase
MNASIHINNKWSNIMATKISSPFEGENPNKPVREKRPLRVGIPEVYRFQTEDGVALRLTRYQGGSKGPVMLVHGLGVASSIFSTDLIDTNLLEYLYAHDYDVWLLDFRISILLPAAKQLSNGDQIAQYDFPAAVAKIQAITGAKTVQAVVHCYGATTFFMSMLAGLQGIRSIVCSQIATNLIIPTATKLKAGLYVPSFLDKLGVDSLTVRVPDGGGSLMTHIYDKTLSAYALAIAQGQCHSKTCHRITFVYASLYRHETLNDRLHTHLAELFAEANIETLKHLAEMCRKGVLVDINGKDIYMPHFDRLNLPILFLSGSKNECYLPESTEITYNLLREKYDTTQYSRQVIEDYAHIDCIFGDNAAEDVFPHIVEHLNKTA